MFSTARPTLTGLQGEGTFSSLQAATAGIGTAPLGGNALTVLGNSVFTGALSASSLTGCISDALTLNSSATAASSAGLSNVYTTANAASVTANAASATASLALPLAGGTVTGGLTVTGQLNASNVTVLGTYERVNALEFHTSNIVCSNAGTGPALSVSQVEGGPLGAQPCALFTAGTSTALYVANNAGVGIGQSSVTAGFALDVSGACRVSSNLNVYGQIGVGKVAQSGYSVDVSGALSVVGAVAVTGTVTATAFSGSGAFLTGLPTAVTLTDSVSTTSSTVAASATAVMTAYNLANAAVPSSGGFVSGTLGVGKNTFPVGGNPDYGSTLDVSGNIYASGTSNVMAGTLAVGKNRVTNNTYALDVSGSVNCAAIATGGSSAKQFDSGSATLSSGIITIAFNFTFNNIPHVVANTTYFSAGNVFSVSITSVSTTGATIKVTYSFQNTSYGLAGNDVIQWIAVG